MLYILLVFIIPYAIYLNTKLWQYMCVHKPVNVSIFAM